MLVIKKIISIAIVALIAVTTISGPAVVRSAARSKTEPSYNVTVPNTEELSEATTSRDINCYILGTALCNREGKTVNKYRLDIEQNITDLSGKVIVTAENAEQFTYATEVRFNENDLRQSLQTVSDREGKESIKPTPITLRLLVQPQDAVNGEITLSSQEPSVLYFPGAAEAVSGNPDSASPSITAEPDENGILEVSMIAAARGHATVKINNVLGEEIEMMEFVFLTGETPPGDRIAGTLSVNGNSASFPASADTVAEKTATDVHEHVYKTQTMNPTIRTKGYTLHVCTICGYTYRDNYTDLDLCHHNWRVVKTVAATDSSAGYTLYECTICGQQERRDPIDQTTNDYPRTCGHLICSRKVIPATCTAGGYTIHECLVCHDYSYTDEETPALGHSWDEGTETNESSCLEAGTKTFTCRSCGEMKTETIPAFGHSWDDGIVTITPAKGNVGIKTYTCKTCGASRTEELLALIHDWDEGTITLEPTCSSTGIKTYTCRVTGDTRTEELEKLPHTMYEEIIPPTETKNGYTRHYCSVCGFEEEHTDITGPIPHEHVYQLLCEEPNCTEAGREVYICESCGDEKDATVLDALGHCFEITSEEPTEEEEGYIEVRCTRCEYSFKGYNIQPMVPYKLSEEGVLDIGAAAEAGRSWLRENGLEISGEADESLESVKLSCDTDQEAAEYAMKKLCFDAVYKTLCICQEDPSLNPLFNCACIVNADTGSAELRCCVSFEPQGS